MRYDEKMMRYIYRKLILVLIVLCCILYGVNAYCQTRCIDSEGEAVIVNNDVPSAKIEAVARAKWAAIEQTVGVEVKAQSVMQNMALVDDAVSRQIKGDIASYKILGESIKDGVIKVRINACVEPTRARDALSSLALNNSVAVFVPAKKPKVVSETEHIRRSPSGSQERYGLQTRDEYDDTNFFSENIIKRLTEQGFTVIDVAPTRTTDAQELEKAIRTGNFLSMRSLMYKFLSNVLLLGRIEYAISTRKGQDIGYGLSMPFNHVTVRLTYRIVTKDNSGQMRILAADAVEGKGLAKNVEDAIARGHKDLADKAGPVIIEKISQYIKGVAKKINVKFEGVNDLNTNFEVKGILQNIAWVTNVDEKGMGEFIVSYPENPVYLANSIGQRGNLRVKSFSTYSIVVIYEK